MNILVTKVLCGERCVNCRISSGSFVTIVKERLKAMLKVPRADAVVQRVVRMLKIENSIKFRERNLYSKNCRGGEPHFYSQLALDLFVIKNVIANPMILHFK